MHHAARFGRALLLQDLQRVFRRAPRVHDQRLARFARRTDVHPEAVALPMQRLLKPVVIQSGFADRKHLRMRGQCDQPFDRGLLRLGRVRMHADRREHIGLRLGQPFGRNSIPWPDRGQGRYARSTGRESDLIKSQP